MRLAFPFRLLLPKSHPDSFHLNRFRFQQQKLFPPAKATVSCQERPAGFTADIMNCVGFLVILSLPLHICRPRTDNEVRQTQRGPSGNSPVPAKTGLLWLDLNYWSDKFCGHSTLLPPAAAADVRTFETNCIVMKA